jgi:hypothetical protein
MGTVSGTQYNSHNYAWGYCHHPERAQSRFLWYDSIIILADIRIYNIEYLQQHFSFESLKRHLQKPI